MAHGFRSYPQEQLSGAAGRFREHFIATFAAVDVVREPVRYRKWRQDYKHEFLFLPTVWGCAELVSAYEHPPIGDAYASRLHMTAPTVPAIKPEPPQGAIKKGIL